ARLFQRHGHPAGLPQDHWPGVLHRDRSRSGNGTDLVFHRADPDPRPKWLRWFLFKVPMSATADWWDRRDAMLRRRAPLRYAIQHNTPIFFGRLKHIIRD